ncbi:MAG TPA: hypothetical protein VJK28_02160, partial [Nitrospiria bacterium]|nr:hypothetical protein [Nitrospiria bacterium]
TLAMGADSWVQLGKRLKASPSTFTSIVASRHALTPSLAGSTDRPYLVWAELDDKGIAQIHVKYWNQDNWISLGNSLNSDPAHQAHDPTIATVGSIPYVVWIELNKKGIAQLQVKKWAQRGWSLEGENLNADPTKAAANPSMAIGSGKPYLAWTEPNEKRVYQIHVKTLAENGWVKLGGSLNEDPLRDAMEPSIGMVESRPFVAWSEKAAHGAFQVYVKRWTGEAWIRDGESLNMDLSAHALSPSIASNGTIPYVAWVEFNEKGISQVHVKHWMNNTWVKNGGSLNVDPSHHALSPSLDFRGDTPYVAWAESDARGVTQIHVKYWTGSDWALEEQTLNLDVSKPALAPTLVVLEDRPYVAWKESDGAGLFSVVVKARQ